MNYLLDTNILVSYLQSQRFSLFLRESYYFGQQGEFFAVSVVTVGELESFALQRKWGKKKIEELGLLLNQVVILDIHSQDIILRYAEIDAYSQGKLEDNALPKGMSARNMGKNDLWIAATASVTQSTLLTTDLDFNHLHTIFLDLKRLETKNF
jgi:tRNA(fMet)-specific endonuclease VapC